MDLRKEIRYNLDDAAMLRQTIGDVRCRFEFDGGFDVQLVDLSLKGFGYRIDDIGGSRVDEIKNIKNFLVTMSFGNDSVAADVRNVWTDVIFDKGRMIFTGGVALEVISPDDRLKLSGIIEKIRSSR